jgi:hypothetical protein
VPKIQISQMGVKKVVKLPEENKFGSHKNSKTSSGLGGKFLPPASRPGQIGASPTKRINSSRGGDQGIPKAAVPGFQRKAMMTKQAKDGKQSTENLLFNLPIDQIDRNDEVNRTSLAIPMSSRIVSNTGINSGRNSRNNQLKNSATTGEGIKPPVSSKPP